MPTDGSPIGVLLRFDGVVHSSDLPVQSFARHLTESLPSEQVRAMIAGMRGFLEGRPELIPAGTDLSDAEDGYQAVDILGRAAGLPERVITAAYRASRVDLAASAWAVDEPDGLVDLIAAIGGHAYLAVLAAPGDPAAATVLESMGIKLELVDTPIVGGLTYASIENASPARVLVVATRWAGDLEVAADAGLGTALVDRYGLGRGTPTLRSPDVAGLLEPIIRWCAEATTATGARP